MDYVKKIFVEQNIFVKVVMEVLEEGFFFYHLRTFFLLEK